MERINQRFDSFERNFNRAAAQLRIDIASDTRRAIQTVLGAGAGISFSASPLRRATS